MMKKVTKSKIIISHSELLKKLNLKGKVYQIKDKQEWTGTKWKNWIELELEE